MMYELEDKICGGQRVIMRERGAWTRGWRNFIKHFQTQNTNPYAQPFLKYYDALGDERMSFLFLIFVFICFSSKMKALDHPPVLHQRHIFLFLFLHFHAWNKNPYGQSLFKHHAEVAGVRVCILLLSTCFCSLFGPKWSFWTPPLQNHHYRQPFNHPIKHAQLGMQTCFSGCSLIRSSC